MTKTDQVKQILEKTGKLTVADRKLYNLGKVTQIISRLRKRGYDIRTVYFGKQQGYILFNRRHSFWYRVLKWLWKKANKGK